LVRVSVHREGQAIEVPGTESLALRVGEAEGRSPAFRKEISALLRGRHKGEEGELDFDWPTGEGEPEAVAGTRVRLHWVISLARGKVSPKLTDDLVKEITQGRETSILAYRGMLRERLKEQKEESTRAAHREKVFAALVEANPLPLPGRMLQRSVDERWENLRKRIEKGRAPEPEDWEAFEATSRAEAREEIIGELRRSLLVAAVMEAEKIEPDMASISERAEALMGGMGGLDQKDPKSRNFLYSVLTHLTNRDVEDRVYQRIVGGPPPAPAAPSPAAEQEEPGHA
ncbi:MAG: hypothetical protein FJ098_14435, partial [Deltaproteobacteria bacterium]|nr:hypothetical protein [Deltaproteobacteria bacterium]